MAPKSRIEELSVVADPWNHKLKPTKLTGASPWTMSFDEKLRHYADKRISLDLDDGVKVNYGKFSDLLSEVKKVAGKKAE